MLYVRRLRVFKEVAGRRSFSEAADALDYTQSAISQQISALERELGLTLIERGTRPVRLSHAGALLLERCDAIFGEIAAAEADLRAVAGLETGALRIGGFATACATLIPSAIATFARRHPAVELSLTEHEPTIAEHRLRAAELDLAVTYTLSAPYQRTDGLQQIHLADDLFVVALPEHHPLAHHTSLQLRELRHERWTVAPARGPSGDYRAYIERLCRASGFEPQIAYESQDLWTGRAIVAAGLAIALMPHLAFTIAHPGVVTRPLTDLPPARAILAVHASKRHNPAIAPMLEILQTTFHQPD